MKLFYSPFHDFVHKVLVVIHEAGLEDAVETIPTFPFRNLDGDWVSGDYDITQLNPLGKVPVLALDDGSTLYASQAIAEYLDSLSQRPLFPASGAMRFDALRRLALGDSIFDFAVQMSMEGWRDPEDRRSDLYDWLWPKIEKSLDQCETEAAAWAIFDIGHAGILQGVSYLDAWAGGRDDIPGNRCCEWQQRWPELSCWFADTIKRPSVRAHYQVPYDGDASVENHAAAIATVLRQRIAAHD